MNVIVYLSGRGIPSKSRPFTQFSWKQEEPRPCASHLPCKLEPSDETNAKNFRVDTHKITLVGHSMGGFIALRTIVDDPDLLGAVCTAGGNISEFGRWAGKRAENKGLYENYIRDTSTPLHGIDVEHLVKDVMENLMKWDLRTHAEVLAKRKLFMIGTANDDEVPLDIHYTPLVDALRQFNPQHLSTIVRDTDHSFLNKRIELAHCIIAWLNHL